MVSGAAVGMQPRCGGVVAEGPADRRRRFVESVVANLPRTDGVQVLPPGY